ncbi:MAG TPA: nucleoside 2-deoxyribosyltransferase [Planctomycetota bacterium]|nr:nucleoside 2-deoxyribosyltransferase [Planctomycetota bacterium]HRR78987.1 nucleoside 2-deoxyribosyltransferase [Planctomycetota bacterium]HRT93435.1 nucleoside 2-deoxyribosyltransferase [Planctomycetota bacterium]
MARETIRVYCAGPLFNAKEQDEMRELAHALECAGLETFLPQRDGLELTKVVHELVALGVEHAKAGDVTAKAIFALDVYQVIEKCQAIVVNLNGRVPDEGAVSEAAIAWCYGKIMVGYKSDSRSVFLGQDNPLVTGLFDFQLCRGAQEVVTAVKRAASQKETRTTRSRRRLHQIAQYLDLGGRIWAAANSRDRIANIAAVLAEEVATHKPDTRHVVAT